MLEPERKGAEGGEGRRGEEGRAAWEATGRRIRTRRPVRDQANWLMSSFGSKTSVEAISLSQVTSAPV